MSKPAPPPPEALNQLFIKANEDHNNGLLDSAEAGYRQLLDYVPQAPLLHANLGLVYYQRQEYEKSRDAFARAAELSPEDMDIVYNLGLSRKRTGDLQGAIRCYQEIVEKDPGSIDALYNLAGCYTDCGCHADAIETYHSVLRLAPDHLSANNNLAFVYHLTGQVDLAVIYYRRVLDCKPDHASAKHMLAALTGSETSATPDSYVRQIFDNYSSHFEQSLLVDLEYCVPAKIRDLVVNGAGRKKCYRHGLDLGCGTGLGGLAFADMVDLLDGVDLSEKMVDLAAAKNIYRDLHVGSIVEFLHSRSQEYDFFLAADVFAYLGDLAETFTLVRERACSDVLFCFSTESTEGQNFRLQPTGRFAHAPDYIEQLALSTGWTVATSRKATLRKEKGSWVAGDIWLLRLTGSP